MTTEWTPTPKSEWVKAGDFCVSAGGMKGRVIKVIDRASLPDARVLWTNKHEGLIRITLVRRLEKGAR